MAGVMPILLFKAVVRDGNENLGLPLYLPLQVAD